MSPLQILAGQTKAARAVIAENPIGTPAQCDAETRELNGPRVVRIETGATPSTSPAFLSCGHRKYTYGPNAAALALGQYVTCEECSPAPATPSAVYGPLTSVHVSYNPKLQRTEVRYFDGASNVIHRAAFYDGAELDSMLYSILDWTRDYCGPDFKYAARMQ